MISARKRVGVRELIDKIESKPKKNAPPHMYGERLEGIVVAIAEVLSGDNRRFMAVKLLENDPRFSARLTPAAKVKLDGFTGEDFEAEIATERYEYIDRLKKAVMTGPNLKETWSDKVDRIILNKYLAFPIFVLVIFGLYFAVIITGTALGKHMETIFRSGAELLARGLESVGASAWAISLVCDGVLGGIGAVLTFIPRS